MNIIILLDIDDEVKTKIIDFINDMIDTNETFIIHTNINRVERLCISVLGKTKTVYIAAIDIKSQSIIDNYKFPDNNEIPVILDNLRYRYAMSRSNKSPKTPEWIVYVWYNYLKEHR